MGRSYTSFDTDEEGKPGGGFFPTAAPQTEMGRTDNSDTTVGNASIEVVMSGYITGIHDL
jgi:hypothetical protein